MNASTRKCTEAKRCHLMNCYLCRRTLIDETATAMLLVPGTTQEDVDRYRHAAINALAFEIQTPAPKAPKASKPTGPVASARAERLQACTTHEQARELLTEKRITVAVLREISKVLGLGTQSKLRKDALIDSLIHFTVGMKLAHVAVLNAK